MQPPGQPRRSVDFRTLNRPPMGAVQSCAVEAVFLSTPEPAIGVRPAGSDSPRPQASPLTDLMRKPCPNPAVYDMTQSGWIVVLWGTGIAEVCSTYFEHGKETLDIFPDHTGDPPEKPLHCLGFYAAAWLTRRPESSPKRSLHRRCLIFAENLTDRLWFIETICS